MIANILIILSLLLLFHYVLFLANIYKGLNKLELNTHPNSHPLVYVSVIIPFRNEANQLPGLIDSLLKIDYPTNKVEFILVDDYSTDDSLEWLNKQQLDERFKIITKNNSNIDVGKKSSIELGIKNASGEIIFVTDADSRPNPNWLKSTIALFDEETGFIAGSVLFDSNDRLFGNLQQIEFAGLMTAAAGLIGINKPATCSAANIAFRKEAFIFVGGYKGNKKLASGDDVFLMKKIHSANIYKVKFNPSPDSIVFTAPNKTPAEFFNQRKRWASKSLFYDKPLILKLILIFLFFFIIPVLIISGIFNSELFYLGLLLFGVKVLIEFIVLKKGAKVIYNNHKFHSFLTAEILHIPYILFSALAGVAGNFEWKQRRLKR